MAFSLDQDGFEIVPALCPAPKIEELRAEFATLGVGAGHRQLMRRVPAVGELARSPKILSALTERLGSVPIPVRAIFFDKTPDANWHVPWHQDMTVAVKEQREIPGYGPWSIKDGVPHVQPPMEILEAMATIRLHLDDCDTNNGALRVIPGSHRHGRLNATRIAELRGQRDEVTCYARTGDALLIRPLLLHASSEAAAPTHRRVIHLEYAPRPLAEGLEWAEATGV